MPARTMGILLAIGCGGVGYGGEPDLDGFGDVASAFIAPCAIPGDDGDLMPSAYGFVKARERSCDSDLQGLVPRFDSCNEYANEDPWAECPSAGADSRSPVFVFQLGAVASPDDLAGESTTFLQLSSCGEVEPDPEYVPADIVVLNDEGDRAEVAIDSERISGRIDARVCR